MASIFEKRGQAGKWYAKYKDEHGKWRDKALPKGIRKAEALRLASELEHTAWRVEQGLDVRTAPVTMTVEGLMQWWLQAESPRTASHARNVPTVQRHFCNCDFGRLPLPEVTPGKVDAFLREKENDLSSATCNHLRMFLHRAFRSARASEVYSGSNPAADVRKRKVAQRKPDYLQADEVPRVLAALSSAWRPLFATAIYTGLRKGELFGLRTEDVRLPQRLIFVRHSHGRDTTKGGREDIVPIADELLPFLQAAIGASKSPYVFPAEDGGRFRDDHNLPRILRSALRKAGITTNFEHVCRKKGCGYSLAASDADPRRCPTHGHLLWPKAKVRNIRFHDLRHTTASLLVMGGADLAAVSRILRHTDPKLTMSTYAHLAPSYLRDQIDRLRFFGGPEGAATGQNGCVATLWPTGQECDQEGHRDTDKSLQAQVENEARPPGFEPGTVGLEGRCSIHLSYGRHATRPGSRGSIPAIAPAVNARVGQVATFSNRRRSPCVSHFFRNRRLLGVTSTSSSPSTNSSASSRLIRRGGTSSSFSSAPADRMFVSFFSLPGPIVRSLSRLCRPTICPSYTSTPGPTKKMPRSWRLKIPYCVVWVFSCTISTPFCRRLISPRHGPYSAKLW
jgi:integrase